VRGPLFGFVIALLVSLIVLALVVFSDIAVRVLEDANRRIAEFANVTPTTEYSSTADQVVSGLAYVLAAATLFAVVAYSAYRGRR